MSHRILIDTAAIAGITFYNVNNTVLDFLNNSHMIGFTVTLPIKEDNYTGNQLDRFVLPLPSVLKPLRAVYAACEFGYNPGINIPALVSAPRHKTSTPFHTRVKAIPTPIRFSAHIADLRQRNGYNLIAAVRDTIKNSRPHRIILIFQHESAIEFLFDHSATSAHFVTLHITISSLHYTLLPLRILFLTVL